MCGIPYNRLGDLQKVGGKNELKNVTFYCSSKYNDISCIMKDPQVVLQIDNDSQVSIFGFFFFNFFWFFFFFFCINTHTQLHSNLQYIQLFAEKPCLPSIIPLGHLKGFNIA